MKWAWKLGRFAGIDVYVHATFLLIVLFVALSHGGGGLASALEGVAFLLAVFACVVLHEFGHALTAARYGIRTRDITLYPIGGVARLERMPEQPLQELWVALAGPAVNVVIAAVLYASLAGNPALRPAAELTVTRGPFLERLLVTNLFLAGFNLIPAFPMDGGRVLRALLALRLEYTRATQIAAHVGQGVALFLGLAGMVAGNPFLMFIALFVWIGAAQEAGAVQMRSALAGIPVARAMLTEFRTLAVTDPLSRAVDLLLAGSQQDFPVTWGDRVAGVLTRADLLKALAELPQSTPVAEVMRRQFVVADPAEMIDAVLARLQDAGCRTVPVLRDGALVGVLTSENLGEFLMVQATLRGRSAPPPR